MNVPFITCFVLCVGLIVRAEDDICQQPKETGPCFASFRRFYFNSGTGRCEQFIYGGCLGNENNFEKIADCQSSCIKRVQGDTCVLPKKIGFCRASLPRFYFNSETGRCEKFNYGGCGGNENNFEKIEDCQSSCIKRVQGDTCLLPKKIGFCRARLPRFYFNSETGRCDKFNYGGCGGNENNFEKIEDCQKACM